MTHRFLHGDTVDQVFADDSISEILWALADNQGTVRDVVNYDPVSDNSNVANHLEFDAFGNITAESDSNVEFRYAYTGRYLDTDTGNQYSRARWLDLEHARFLSEDPKGFAAGDVNFNRYVFNSPANFVDPDGLTAVGHHFFPQAVVETYTHLMTKDAYYVAMGHYSGATYPHHLSGTYGGITHPQYSKLVEQKFQKYLLDNKITKTNPLTDKQMQAFINDELVGAHGNSKIGKFNKAIMETVTKKKWTPAAQATTKQLIERGEDFVSNKATKAQWEKIRRPAKIKSKLGLGTKVGASALATVAFSSVADAAGALNTVARSNHYGRALDALEKGQVGKAHGILVGAGQTEELNSLAGEIQATNAEAGLAFEKYVNWLFSKKMPLIEDSDFPTAK